MNKRFQTLVVLYGFVWVVTMVVLMFSTFLLAFFFGGVRVTVDSFGEANLELILLLTGLPCVVYCLYFLITEEKQEG